MTSRFINSLWGATLRLTMAFCIALAGIGQAAAVGAPKTVVVLVDLSDSAKDWKQAYMDDFRTVLDHLEAGDKLLVSRIIRNPSAADPLPIHLTLRVEESGDNPRKARQERLLQLTGALLEFEELLQSVESATPIVEVLEKVPRWFQAFANERRIVVLMSDMREYSPTTANFEAKAGWKASSLDAFLANLGKQRLIPDLKGARIYVAGARDHDESRLRAVRGFWQRYFAEARAEFAPHRYESRLLQFDECNVADACKARLFRDNREAEIRKHVEQQRRK